MAPVSKVDIDLKISEVMILDPTRPASDRYVELHSKTGTIDPPSSLSGHSLIFIAENLIEVRSNMFLI